MVTTEEFSFPSPTTDLFPCGIESPPLWNVSPSVSPGRKAKGKEGEDDKCLNKEEGDNEEEKMDMLWEDFNEELGGGIRRQDMKLSKSNGRMLSPNPRKVGMRIFMRVLRKLFLLHNSQVKHSTCQISL
ncbi:uncharacterized protein LOC120212225 [Hibiscus syriacus]|uniref:uncharacterized protein LOC120212225 n=1 Tax=Hibiscus syriacus TaxID=106335 RepID=UPI0019209FEB|nr:uncharacterized protein LOC120212225 [Hibiscus syriacus]